MDKETLSNYGWIVICVLVLAVMIALATPFGSYVADGFKAAYKGFGDTNTEATDMMYSAVGVKVPASCGIEGHYKGDNRGTHGIPTTDCTKGHRYTCECVSWVVPEGGTYTMATAVNGKSVYNAGEALPNHYVMKNGDKFESTDYNYTPDYTGGWRVYVKDKAKTEYEAILPEIAGKPITNMRSTFNSCASLIMAPSIPNSVMVLDRTFVDCTSLKTAPKIPDGITDMSLTFQGCSSLTTAPVVPSTVTDMTQTFYGCKSLKTAPSIPNSVTNMGGTFWDCISLTIAPVIPDSVTNMGLTFDGCKSLETASSISNNVTNMNATFSDCTSLTTAPKIPDSVTNMNSTFSGCTSLTGTIEINANPANYGNCLQNTQITEVTGSTTLKAEILATK